jgi:hypothetical protein
MPKKKKRKRKKKNARKLRRNQSNCLEMVVRPVSLRTRGVLCGGRDVQNHHTQAPSLSEHKASGQRRELLPQGNGELLEEV